MILQTQVLIKIRINYDYSVISYVVKYFVLVNASLLVIRLQSSKDSEVEVLEHLTELSTSFVPMVVRNRET